RLDERLTASTTDFKPDHEANNCRHYNVRSHQGPHREQRQHYKPERPCEPPVPFPIRIYGKKNNRSRRYQRKRPKSKQYMVRQSEKWKPRNIGRQKVTDDICISKKT